MARQITDCRALDGKTVVCATAFSDWVIIAFADGDYLFLESTWEHDCSYLRSKRKAEDYQLHAAGVIDDAECNRRKAERKSQYVACREEQDRAQYAKLKAKFEPEVTP